MGETFETLERLECSRYFLPLADGTWEPGKVPIVIEPGTDLVEVFPISSDRESYEVTSGRWDGVLIFARLRG